MQVSKAVYINLQTLLAKPRKRLLTRLWIQCYKDRLVFGHARVGLTQAELDTLLEPVGEGVTELAVLPKDPRDPMSRDRKGARPS